MEVRACRWPYASWSRALRTSTPGSSPVSPPAPPGSQCTLPIVDERRLRGGKIGMVMEWCGLYCRGETEPGLTEPELSSRIVSSSGAANALRNETPNGPEGPRRSGRLLNELEDGTDEPDWEPWPKLPRLPAATAMGDEGE